MKIQHSSIWSMLVIFLVPLSGAIAQTDSSSNQLRNFGMGIHAQSVLHMNYSPDNENLPANLILTRNISNNWRIEPEIGLHIINNKKYDIQQYGFQLGLGGFWQFQRPKTNFYLGPRFYYTYIYTDYNEFVNNQVKTNTYHAYSLGPFVGSEYLFGPHFSIGIETGLLLKRSKSERKPYDLYPTNEWQFLSNSSLLVRFYF